MKQIEIPEHLKTVECVNSQPLKGNAIAPPVVLGQKYPVHQIIECPCGEQHYDVGIKSPHNYVQCYKCRADLPTSAVGEIYWTHSSRYIPL